MSWILIFICVFGIIIIFLNRYFEEQSKQSFRRTVHENKYAESSEKLEYKQAGYTSPSSWKKEKPDHKKIAKTFNQADLLYSHNDFEAAEKLFIEVIAQQADHLMANNKLGLIYLKRGKFIKAEAVFLRLIEISPKNALFYSNLGLSLYNQSKLKFAKQAYEQAIQLETKESRYLSLGQVCVDLENYKDAVNAFSKALELNPKNTDLYFFIADLLIKIEAYDEAKAYITTYMDEKPYSKRAKEKLREIKIASKESPLS